MIMQHKTWMTKKRFHAWISHFVQSIGNITPNNQHLLNLQRHGFHVTLEIVCEA